MNGTQLWAAAAAASAWACVRAAASAASSWSARPLSAASKESVPVSPEARALSRPERSTTSRSMGSSLTRPDAVRLVAGAAEALGAPAVPPMWAPVAVSTRVAAAAVGRRYPDPTKRGREEPVDSWVRAERAERCPPAGGRWRPRYAASDKRGDPWGLREMTGRGAFWVGSYLNVTISLSQIAIHRFAGGVTERRAGVEQGWAPRASTGRSDDDGARDGAGDDVAEHNLAAPTGPREGSDRAVTRPVAELGRRGRSAASAATGERRRARRHRAAVGVQVGQCRPDPVHDGLHDGQAHVTYAMHLDVRHVEIGVLQGGRALGEHQLVDVGPVAEEAGAAALDRLLQLLHQRAPGTQLLHDPAIPRVRQVGPVVGAAQGDQRVDPLVPAQPGHVVAGDEPAHAVPDHVDPLVAGLGHDGLDLLGQLRGGDADVLGVRPHQPERVDRQMGAQPERLHRRAGEPGGGGQGLGGFTDDVGRRGGGPLDRTHDPGGEARRIPLDPRRAVSAAADGRPTGGRQRTRRHGSATLTPTRGLRYASRHVRRARPGRTPRAPLRTAGVTHPSGGGETGPGRPRPRREGRGEGLEGRWYGGRLHRP